MSKNFNVYTDLAIESHQNLTDTDFSMNGVFIYSNEIEDFDIVTTEVVIDNEDGEKLLNKPRGTYFTIESSLMKHNEMTTHEKITDILTEKMKELMSVKKDSVTLVVGLGNRNVTPDSLGPKVVDKLLVTRHIVESDNVPLELEEKVSAVCALAPGVMGITGIETAEIIKGVVSKVKPDLVVAIDALAARETGRINATIQMCDTEVNPGAGMGNKRMSLNKENLGVPVIAIGVPTVVDAATLVNDTLDKMLSEIIDSIDEGSEFYSMLKNLESNEKYNLIANVLEPYSGNMFVTPKEVDSTIDRLSGVIATAINRALHPNISKEEISSFLY